MLKRCAKCGIPKDTSEFNWNDRKQTRLKPYCQQCQREISAAQYAKRPDSAWEHRLRREYGLLPEQYELMLKAQNGVCKICHQLDSGGAKLSVDHDHQTGKNRGLLCRKCNLILGKIQDNLGWLESASNYLKEYR
jgi:hypothetical protein